MNVRHVLEAAPALVVTFALSIIAVFAAPFPARGDAPKPITLVAFGDSLTAGYGLKTSESFPAQLQMALQAKGYKVTIVNAGVSGDTTADGLRRFDWAMQPKPDGVILELGANDALRGIDPKVPGANLDKMLAALKAQDVDVLLTGMKAPNNWGEDYAKAFDALIVDVYMPVIDGARVIQTARGELGLADLPIIAVSAGGDTARKSALDAGANIFLDKPMRLRQVIDTIQKLLT